MGKIFIILFIGLFIILGFKKKQTSENADSKLLLYKEDIKPLVNSREGCLATKMITVEGKKVNFMYREYPSKDYPDSGWRFFSGFKDDEYLNDLKNTQVFALNTVVNFDPDIIPFLESSYITAFERNPDTGKFEQVLDFEFPK